MKRARGLQHAAFALLLAACGSRTGLFVEDTPEALPIEDDGGIGTGRKDAARDAPDAEMPDAPPPIDVAPPPDVFKNDCPDADSTLVYVITEQYELFSFFPPDATFKKIGNIACPAPSGTTPFSMAVDRKGIAYIVFNDGHLYRVSTASAACIGTSFVVGQQGFTTFGMGYATDLGGPSESLYVAGDMENGQGATGLAKIDTTSFGLSRIGDFTPAINRAELTGTGGGQLFAFYAKTLNATDSYIGEIDKTTANIIGESHLATVNQGGGWAFAFWGGDFYTFTAPDGPSSSSLVQRFRPMDGTVVQVTTLPTTIVGAGVSTCAPE
ncbi:MAG TPA: hypothetical protein VIF62_36540 [Labilithrix sp.]